VFDLDTYKAYMDDSIIDVTAIVIGSRGPSHHEKLSTQRRELLAVMYGLIKAQQCTNVVYIGGHIKREVPVAKKNTIYINPPISSADLMNNGAILSVIS